MTLSKNATNRRAKSIPLIQSGISEFAEYVNKKTFSQSREVRKEERKG
jgi:hypothetical protein